MPHDVLALTERQQMVLGTIRKHAGEEGISPTQIGRHLGFQEKEASSKVMNALAKLQKWGLVERFTVRHERDVRYRSKEAPK